MIKKLIFIFSIFCCLAPAWGLTLKVMRPGADTQLEIALHATKRAEHALAVKMADGTIYYADMMPVANSFPGGMFARIDSQIYQVGPVPKFFVTTTTDTDSFSFTMSAAGSFIVDWGDGDVQQIVRTDTESVTYSHTYSAASGYTIGIGGRATGYTTETQVGAISFTENLNIGGISGSLGAVFGTIGDGSGTGQQPSFYQTFSGCKNLTGAIPEKLFAGITGTGVPFMFGRLFSHCTGLTDIPENLFATIKGPGQYAQFFDMFNSCSGIKTIPENLFASVTGPAAQSMFHGTFHDVGITTIPAKLFANITGPSGSHAFAWTFDGCNSLDTIPEKLFANISGPTSLSMFEGTFKNCENLTAIPQDLFGSLSGPLTARTFADTFENTPKLTGKSAKINGKYLYEIWPDAVAWQVGGCYSGATGLSDYANIPAAWK